MKTPQYIIISLVVILMASFAISTNAQSLPTITMDKPIQDMTISELQTKIAEILSVIQQLQALIAQLQPGGVSCNFYRNLYPGISGPDVKCLQQYLNNAGHTIANSGPGSSNKETIYYGSLTRAAVKKWQDANNIEPGAWWGYFGPKSQAIYNELTTIPGEQEEPPTPPSSGTYCGDNIAQRPSDQGTIEDCDGTDLRNKTCITQGYTGGTLSCSNDCSFNTSQCTGTGPDIPTPPEPPGPTTSCGDSIMQTPNSEGIYEVCDSTNLGTSTCLTYGYVGGTLSCSSDCITFNTTNCITESGGGGGGGGGEPEPEPDPGPVCGDTDGICPSGCTYSQDTDCTYCGDSIIQSPNDEGISEVCDTTSLAGETCITKGFPGGTLQCSSTCLTFDTSSCTWPEPPNEAPVLNPIGNKTISENSLLTFIISATDPDGDDLSYSISDIPSGAIFNASIRTFTWTPLYTQSGTYNTTFTVSDGSLTDTETITITVSNVNRAPVLSPIGSKTVDENSTLTFTVSGTDLDGDTLYYSIIDTPSGASFNSSTRTFTWTPTYEQSGTYFPTFIVSDTEYIDQETITITVNNVETVPVCGDSICEGTETCSTCPADCGECAPSFPTDYISYWKFDGDAIDETGTNNGTFNGDATTVYDSARNYSTDTNGYVLSLDGTGDYVDIGSSIASNLPLLSISAWARSNIPNISESDYIVQESVGASLFWEANENVYFIVRIDGSNHAAFFENGIEDTNWHHLVGVYNGTDVLVYVDGVVGGTTASITGNIDDNQEDFIIGTRDVSARFWNGTIDDVMIYNRALSETEIQQIYNAQSGGPPICTDDPGCSAQGSFCDTDTPYTCSLGGDGCLDRADGTDCTLTGEICQSGACVPDPCFGISLCSDYDQLECAGDSCDISTTSGCIWNAGVCEEIPEPYCGDSICNGTETCSTCPADCGECLPTTWTPPIGIPAPSFGIEETHLMYEGELYDFGSGPEPYKDAGNGPYTHYVDKTDPGCIDSGNDYGTASNPRCNIPTPLAAGSVVEIHGGSYEGDKIVIRGTGTKEKPIFIRGVSELERPVFAGRLHPQGSYMIFENLYLNNGGGVNAQFIFRIDYSQYPADLSGPIDHITLRNSELEGSGLDSSKHGIGVQSSETELPENIVIYNNTIHDFGKWDIETDLDAMGVLVTSVRNMWIVDNHIYNTGADSVQVHDPYGTTWRVNYVYIGRNLMYDNKENAVDIKQSQHVIISDNEMYGFWVSATSSVGPAIVLHYTPVENIWIIHNNIYSSQVGIHSTAGLTSSYIINNLFHDIAGNAIQFREQEEMYVVGNTIYDSGGGIIGQSNTNYALYMSNNIISDLKATDDVHLGLAPDPAINSMATYNSFYQTGDSPIIKWAGTTYDVAGFIAAYPTKVAGSIEADPQFLSTDPLSPDFLRPDSTSPTIDNGTSSDVYQRFYDLYGIDIKKDIEGRTRPQGLEWDIGAYESGALPARISQTDEKLDNLASVLSSMQSAVQDIIKRMQSLF